MTQREFWPLAGLIALRGVATFVVVALGFFAISDDDFARVVIAQSFAENPKLDPSGSSWLPFPFWLNGGAMALFGRHLWVARGVAVASSLASVAALYGAARLLDFTRLQAWLAAAAFAVLPYAVWLGYATVPELLSASACLLAAATTSVSSTRARTLGAALLVVATLSRYESWAIALAVGAINALDAVRQKRPSLLLPAALCAAGPLSWMAHGMAHHDSATFFVSRVVDYKRMLGRGSDDLLSSLLHYPRLLVVGEPELMLTTMAALFAVGRVPRTLIRPLVIGLCLLVFLIYGDARDGAPTHHAERPLLMLWLVACLLLGWALPQVWRQPRRRLAVPLFAAVLGLLARSLWSRRDDFIDRRDEVAFGHMLRERLPDSARLLIDLGDYGYFAVIAGFETPSRAHGLAAIDPRQAVLGVDSPLARLRQLARDNRSTHVVLPTAPPPPAGLGSLDTNAFGLALVRLAEPPESARATR